MNTRQSWIIGAAIVIGCLILSVSTGQRSGADEKPGQKAEPVTVGRFHLDRQEIGGSLDEVVIDTSTGRVWRYAGGEWKDLGPLAQPQK
jgi:hypothetical protein